MTEERFKRILFDGGFHFGDDYVPPIWSINDSVDRESPIGFLEFKDEYKDLCDEIVNFLNSLSKENEKLKLKIDGLQYALKNIKKIDVEIDLNE
jgi:hypothetical protein